MAGLGKYFNSDTYTGRANVAKATYASFALMYLYFRLRRAGKKQENEDQLSETPQAPTNSCTCMQCQPPPCVPCQPSCTPVAAPQSPTVEEKKDEEREKNNLKEDPLFKPKIRPPTKKGSTVNECEDEDYEDEC